MSTEHNSPDAPAVEVIFGVSFAWPTALDAIAWEKALKDGLAEDLPMHEQQLHGRLEIQASEKGFQNGAPGAFQVVGHRLWSVDKKLVAHFNTAGFSVHRLAPYPGFEAVLPFVQKCWDLFVQIARPIAVTRLAMRYINVLQLPKEADASLNTDKYFKMPLHAPGSAFQVRGFHVVYDMSDERTDALLRCAVSTLPSPNEQDPWPVALDIEAALEDQHMLPWEVVEDRFRDLRGACNRNFDAVVKDEYSTLFK